MRGVFIAAGMSLIGALPANAADGNQMAYTYAMRCFAANAVALNRQDENPQGTQTNYIREKAKHDNEVVYQLGGILGLSQSQISDDFDRAQATEMRLLVGGAAYFAKTKADCVKLGLM